MKKGVIIKTASVLGVLILGFSLMSFLGSTSKQSNKKDLKPDVRTVTVETINFGDIILEVEGNGVIQSQRTLDIVAEASGRVVFAKNNLKNGTSVKEGEVILKIDDREVRNTLLSQRSDFLNSVASVIPEMKIENEKIYKKWMAYFESIDINSSIPDLPELSTTQEQIKLSTRQVFSKFYAVRNQEILLSKHTIVAPYDGYIKSNGIIKNSYISRGQNLLSFIDIKNLEIAVPLLVEEYNKIDFSKVPSVKIHSPQTDDVIYGKLSRQDPKLDRNSQSINVYVTLQNKNAHPSFLPGNYIDLAIVGKEMKNVALIPRFVIDNENHVYTMEDGTLGKVKVELVTMQGANAVIAKTADIADQTKVVTTILQKPLVGMKIQELGAAPEIAESDSVDTSLAMID